MILFYILKSLLSLRLVLIEFDKFNQEVTSKKKKKLLNKIYCR